MLASVYDIFGMIKFLGHNSTVYDIHSDLVLGIYALWNISASWLVLCTVRVLHVVPMILYHWTYCELLLLFLVDLPVCGCNKTIYRYVCKLIGVYRVLIYRVHLGLVLLVESLCLTIGGRSLHIQ